MLQILPRRQADSNAKPTKPSQYHFIRNAVMWVNRYCNNDLPCLPDDDEGRNSFVAMRALALPDKEIDNVAPWLREAPEELAKLDKRAKYFTANSTTIGQLIKLTKKVRDAYAAGAKPGKRRNLPIRAYNEDWDDHLQEIEARRNANRNQKRVEARAALIAACGDPREMAVMTALRRISDRPGCSPPRIYVRDIMGAMTRNERKTFEVSEASLPRIVQRTLDRLVTAGRLQKCGGGRGRLAHYFELDSWTSKADVCRKPKTPTNPGVDAIGQPATTVALAQGLVPSLPTWMLPWAARQGTHIRIST